MTRTSHICALAAVSLAASTALAAPPRQSAYDFAKVHINNDPANTQQKAVETDYVPNVVQAENGANTVHEEALKAQAVAARTFLYYKLNNQGWIGDGQNDQVYTGSGTAPNSRHLAAARDTEREVLRWGTGLNDVTIASFYVSGTRPSTSGAAPFGVAEAGDTPSATQEKWVTYNRGRAGNNITQTELGWTEPVPSNAPAATRVRVAAATLRLLPEVNPFPKYPWSTLKFSICFTAGRVPVPGVRAISKWMSAP